MSIHWEPLWEIVQSHERFVLSSHVRPDADAIGSEIAMANLLEGLGKSVNIINPSAAPQNLGFLDPRHRVNKFGETASADDVHSAEVHIVLDTSAWKQLLAVGEALKTSTAKRVVIDHHVSADSLDAVEFKDTCAEATGTLVFRFADEYNLPISNETASALYCAIATDTGWFRFPATTSETMQIVARLMDAGARPHELYSQLYEQHSIGRLRLSGLVLGRVQLAAEGRIAWTYVRRADFKDMNATPADTEGLVNQCLTIGGTQASFIAVEQGDKTIKVSLRSRGPLDVSRVAERFGGGGHKLASGTMVDGPLDQAADRVLAAMCDGLE